MGRRTSKKSKKNIKKGIEIHNNAIKTVMEKVEEFNSSQDWDRQLDRNPFDDFRAIEEQIEHSFSPIPRNYFTFNSCINGRCAVCNMGLNYNYPEDYPDEWKFCCFCQPNAKMLIEGTLKPTNDKLKKLYDKITLVKGNDDKTD